MVISNFDEMYAEALRYANIAFFMEIKVHNFDFEAMQKGLIKLEKYVRLEYEDFKNLDIGNDQVYGSFIKAFSAIGSQVALRWIIDRYDDVIGIPKDK